MKQDPLILTNEQIFYLTLSSIIAFAVVICTIVIAFRNNGKLFALLNKNEYTFLKILTVLVVVWAVTGLAIIGKLNEPVSAIFGAIIGYVFGSIRGNRNDENS